MDDRNDFPRMSSTDPHNLAYYVDPLDDSGRYRQNIPAGSADPLVLLTSLLKFLGLGLIFAWLFH
jgi:hypothetical protein